MREAIHRVDAVIHHPPRGCGGPLRVRSPQPDVDVAGTANLLDAIAESGPDVHLVYIAIVGVDALPWSELSDRLGYSFTR